MLHKIFYREILCQSATGVQSFRVLTSALSNDVKNVVLAWYRYALSCQLCYYVDGYQEQLGGNSISLFNRDM
jgi:hypothetical protein